MTFPDPKKIRKTIIINDIHTISKKCSFLREILDDLEADRALLVGHLREILPPQERDRLWETRRFCLVCEQYYMPKHSLIHCGDADDSFVAPVRDSNKKQESNNV